MKVFVTGATGFLGRYIVERLIHRGDQVRALCRQATPELSQRGVEIVLGDLSQEDVIAAACRDVQTVFHVASVAGIWGPWQYYYQINTVGTQNVLAGCRRHGVERLVYTSSPSVTFDGSDQCGIDESAPYPSTWLCHYPHTKALAEQAVLAANGIDGLKTCSLRPHLIWGPGDRHLIPRLVHRARSGRLRQVGDGTNLIDMIYVENAALAHLQAADSLVSGSPTCGRAYFITQGEPVNCWQWINEILALAGIPALQRRISFRTAWKIGACLETIYRALRLNSEPPMTRFLAAQLAKHHYFSIERARRDFGYRPMVSTAEGMRQLGQWLAK